MCGADRRAGIVLRGLERCGVGRCLEIRKARRDLVLVGIAQEHPEFSEWRWIDAAAMIDAIVPFKRDIYRQVVTCFREHLA